MRVLVWQWGRRGAGPLVAAVMAQALSTVPGTTALLSLSTGAELLRTRDPPATALPFATYASLPGLIGRVLSAPWTVPRLARWIVAQQIDVSLCAMPAALDLLMAAAMRRAGVPFAVVVHDAQPHPGDVVPAQARLQRALLRRAAGVFTLTAHVADHLPPALFGCPGGPVSFRSSLPPLVFAPPPAAPRAHGGPLRLLSFGRLLPYKGLDLLQQALAIVGPRPDLVVRVVGRGPPSPELIALAAMPGVTVENRWVPEDEMAAVVAWADVLALSHREASQSGVAAAALAARRWVIATDVGGLREQLAHEPAALICPMTATGLAVAIRTVLSGGLPLPAPAIPGWDAQARQMAADLRTLLSRTRAR